MSLEFLTDGHRGRRSTHPAPAPAVVDVGVEDELLLASPARQLPWRHRRGAPPAEIGEAREIERTKEEERRGRRRQREKRARVF